MSPKSSLLTLLCVLALLAAACGGSDPTNIETAGESAQSQTSDEDYTPDDPIDRGDPTNDDLAEGPLPVEPDGGIGDGAEPIPGADDPVDEGTWHGAEVAETNCPGTEWQRVQASAFSFSVPADFVEDDVNGVDSEVGIWTGGNKVEVSYDYGWYSGSLGAMEGAENEAIDYSGFVGQQTILRDDPQKWVAVYFGQVELDGGDQWNKLGLSVNFTDADDEIIGRCIVGSIDFDV